MLDRAAESKSLEREMSNERRPDIVAQMSAGSRRASASPTTTVDGPAASVLAATVARRYYLDGASKIEIAQACDIDLERFVVRCGRNDHNTRHVVRHHGA